MEAVATRKRQNPEYYKRYYLENRERISMLNKKRYEERRSTPEGLKKHRERATELTKIYRSRHPEKVKESRRSVYLNRKYRAMELVGGAKCVRCGCDYIDFLEFNHINGGGCKEWRKNKKGLVDRLLSGDRDKSGLEVLCRVCNAVDYLERKSPEASGSYKIEFIRKRYAKFIGKEDEWESITPVVTG